jgi:tetratricopeptide (TPR) repeat protein
MRIVTCLVALLLAPQLALDSTAQNLLDEAKRYYDAAAYEDALAALSKVERSSGSQIVQVEQYRAFCFIALGRAADAQGAVAALVNADPLYVPAASPRVLSVVSEIRRNLLPSVARRLLDNGRNAFAQKNFDEARESFQLLLRVLDDPAIHGRPEVQDFRVLAEGFAALMNATPVPTPTSAGAAAADTTEAKTTGPAPAAVPVVVPPVAVREVLPPWVPPDQLTAKFEYTGTLRITIGVDGRVKAATIQDRSHASYDLRLLEAARTWIYKPATRDGEPVEFDKLLEIKLRGPEIGTRAPLSGRSR